MTTDVRTLLHDTADAPSRGPDVEGAMRSARGRRRRRRGLGATVAVVAVALVGGVFVATGGGGGDDAASVAIGPRQTESSVPDGWKTIHAGPGITIAVPAAWKVSQSSETPIGVPVLSLGDLSPLADEVLAACTVSRTPSGAPEEGGSLITMWEFPGSSTEVPGTDNTALSVVGRPTTFSEHLVLGPRTCAAAQYQQVAFRDAGRVFLVRAVSVIPPDAENPELLALAAKVLDTLRVEPLTTSGTTTVPDVSAPTTTLPLAAATTVPPFTASTDDEREIVQVFERWADSQTDADLDAIAEDPDAVRAPSHQGWDQHPTDLARYDGRVESIRMTDSDHAQVVYSILYGGRPAYANRLGSAVRVDGTWKVSTETVCGMLALGGIRCPA